MVDKESLKTAQVQKKDPTHRDYLVWLEKQNEPYC